MHVRSTVNLYSTTQHGIAGNSKLHTENSRSQFASKNISHCALYRTTLAVSSNNFHITEIKRKIETVQNILDLTD
jgi:hypothetical protein